MGLALLISDLSAKQTTFSALVAWAPQLEIVMPRALNVYNTCLIGISGQKKLDDRELTLP